MTEIQPPSVCPACGEPVKPTWRICPACEMRLHSLTCPRCKMEVKENWRRCPECEILLVCPGCGNRSVDGETICSRCIPIMKSEPDNASIFVDPVCGMELVRVSGGVFQMGDTLDQGLPTELPVHEIMLDDFFIARFTVTQVQWDILMGENPSNFKDPQNPVEQITWSDALEFAEKLSRAVSSSVNKPIEFMLPTEAQWEFAARSGGKNDLYSGGSDISAVAWIDENSRGRSHPVGQKRPNDLGIYDMSGNVWEWCLDTFQEDAFSRHDKFNPMMTASSPDRVIRGGSWNLDAWSARCGRRFNFPADFFGPALGFRLVMDRK